MIDDPTDVNGTGVRRIKVTTPFGVATSTIADGFKVSASPDYLPAMVAGGGPGSSANAATTFAGSADYNGSDYNASVGTGLLVINGSNFRGVNSISFMNNASAVTFGTVTPATAGVTINAAGTQMTITKTAIETSNSTWVSGTSTDRTISMTSAGGQTTSTPIISVKE